MIAAGIAVLWIVTLGVQGVESSWTIWTAFGGVVAFAIVSIIGPGVLSRGKSARRSTTFPPRRV